jgi:PAS domain S-box-containing protein
MHSPLDRGWSLAQARLSKVRGVLKLPMPPLGYLLEIGVSARSVGRVPRQLLDILLLATLYFVVAKGGLALASIHPSASPVWPPSGVALAALLLVGPRLWPGIFLGAFLANIFTFGSAFTSMAIAGGNTLEAVITAALLTKWSGGAATFDTPLQVAKFSLLCLVPGTILAATVGVGSLTLAGYANPQNAEHIWLTWWLGDASGQLLLTPVIVLWARADRSAFASGRLRSSGAVLAATAFVGFMAFGPLFAETPLQTPLAFFAIIPLLWAALRFDRRDTAAAALVLCGFAIWGTLENRGPLVGATINDSFILDLCFVISTVVPSLLLSADVAVRKRIEHDARRLASIVESSEDAIIATDLSGLITSWNRGAQRLYGYTREEVIGQCATLLLPADIVDEEESLLQRIRRGDHVDHFETVRRRKDGTPINVSLSVSPIKNADRKIVGASKIARDITERKRAEQRQTLVFGEMHHRIKNSFAILQAIANQTLPSASAEDRAAFVERLHALARAQDLLTLERWNHASLREVVGTALNPFQDAGHDRFRIQGPEIQLKASKALLLGLTIHELATNAGKYGALSNDHGYVWIEWQLRQDRDVTQLNLSWQECGGPEVLPRGNKGFGSLLIERGLTSEGCQCALEFLPTGLRWRLSMPLEVLEPDEPARMGLFPTEAPDRPQ